MKNPPILISILGFFAALAGFGFLFFGLRVLGSTGSVPSVTCRSSSMSGCGVGWRSPPGSSGSSPPAGSGRSSRGHASSR